MARERVYTYTTVESARAVGEILHKAAWHVAYASEGYALRRIRPQRRVQSAERKANAKKQGRKAR